MSPKCAVCERRIPYDRKRYCSDACGILARSRRRGGLPESNAEVHKLWSRRCKCCNSEIHIARWHFCNKSCRTRYKCRQRRGRPPTDQAFYAGEEVACRGCGGSFTRYVTTHIYCSSSCRERYFRRVKKTHSLESLPNWQGASLEAR